MAANFLIDHVIIRVDDLAAAVRDYTALGFTVTPGGEHPGLGSHNALIPFADGSYLELIAYRTPGPRRLLPRYVRAREFTGKESPIERHVLPWETAPEGLVDFALLPSNVETAIAEARGRGLALDGPIPGGRLRPDGRRVAWQLALTYLFDLPFLCSDVTPRSLRVPEGPARQHANGAVGVSKLVVGVNNLAESTARYRALLGQEPQASRFVLGSATIELIAPARDDLGEGPCLLSLRTRDAHRAGDLNLSQTYHARIRLET